jgi:hypothetical protein
MNNWFYMDRNTFAKLLFDELGQNLALNLIAIDFDTAVSFLIGETSDEILTKIQQTFSRRFCHKIICNEHCITCSLSPPNYAKLAWFVQRLFIMSPLSKPFIRKTSSSKLLNDNSTSIQRKNTTTSSSSNDDCSLCGSLIIIIIFLIVVIALLISFQM